MHCGTPPTWREPTLTCGGSCVPTSHRRTWRSGPFSRGIPRCPACWLRASDRVTSDGPGSWVRSKLPQRPGHPGRPVSDWDDGSSTCGAAGSGSTSRRQSTASPTSRTPDGRSSRPSWPISSAKTIRVSGRTRCERPAGRAREHRRSHCRRSHRWPLRYAHGAPSDVTGSSGPTLPATPDRAHRDHFCSALRTPHLEGDGVDRQPERPVRR